MIRLFLHSRGQKVRIHNPVTQGRPDVVGADRELAAVLGGDGGDRAAAAGRDAGAPRP